MEKKNKTSGTERCEHIDSPYIYEIIIIITNKNNNNNNPFMSTKISE